MRSLVLFVPFLVVGVIISGYYGNKIRKIRAVEEETQERSKNASKDIREDLELKRQRDELRVNWDNEHLVISDEAFVDSGYRHLSQLIGGTTVSCPKCKELH